MARNGVFSRRRWSENVEDLGFPAPDSQEVHVLAVDDSLVDRKVIERLLRISSCKVTAVDSGRRALEFLGLDEEQSSVGLDGLKVDLIITDYCMPGMTGYELLKKIKESSTFREIPVVIMSSENVLPRINRCLEEGAEDFIVKPVKLADVKRLKDHMMLGDDRVKPEHPGINKRKSPDSSDDLSPPPSPPFNSSSSSSPPSSPSSHHQSFLSPSSSSDSSEPSSPMCSPSPSPPPSPPVTLDSPTRRLKMSICD